MCSAAMSALARSFDAIFRATPAHAEPRVPPSIAARDFALALAASSARVTVSVARAAKTGLTAAGARTSARGESCEASGDRSPGAKRVRTERDGASCTVPLRRRSYNKLDQVSLGQEALEMRRKVPVTNGSCRGWLQAFLQERYDIEDHTCEGARALRNQIKSAVRSVHTGNVQRPALRGRKRTYWCSQTPSRHRKRAVGGGRSRLASEIADELWCWFVDRLHNVPGRVNTALLLAQARLLAADMQECWRKRAELREVDPQCPPVLPKLDHTWIARWRQSVGVTWRTVNLRYKISAAKRLSRLRVFWCNVLRLRFFHRALVGSECLKFVGFDQKPFYFNSSVAAKTLAIRGCRKAAVKENVAASRERYTLMTNVQSWNPEAPPPCAIMFRVVSSTGARIRARLNVPHPWLLQFAQKGSYRTEHVLAFLDWWAAPVTRVADTIVMVLDWFAPHLDERVDHLLHDAKHAVLRIGGGLTPDVQVGDTHRHGPLTRVYRDLEAEDAQRELSLRPSHLPSSSRQTVMERAFQAWTTVSHLESAREWRENAITQALGGSEDADIRSDLLPVWHQLDMPRLRTQIATEVAEEVQAGRLTSWDQYPELLEPYDEHPPIADGWDEANRQFSDEDDDDGEDGDDPDDGDTPAALRGEEEEVAGAASPDPTEEASAGVVVETSATFAKATDALTLQEEELARKDLAGQSDGKRLQALSDAAALLKQCGEDGAAQTLEERMARLAKHAKALSNPTRLYLRARGLARKGEEVVARATAAERDRVMKELDTRLKLAKADVELQKTAAGVDKAKAKEAVNKLAAGEANGKGQGATKQRICGAAATSVHCVCGATLQRLRGASKARPGSGEKTSRGHRNIPSKQETLQDF